MVSRIFPRGIAPFTTPLSALSLAGLAVVLISCTSANTTREHVIPSPTATGELAKPAATILADARRELLASTSVRVRGTLTQVLPAPAPTPTKSGVKSTGPSAKPTPKTSVQQRLDLRVGRGSAGQALATGTITTIASAGGQTLKVPIAVIRVADQLYIKADASYYARIGPKVALAAGHWLSLPTSQDQAFADFTDVTKFTAGLKATGARTGGLLKLANQSTVVVQTAGALVYVAASGPPRLVRLQRPASADTLAGSLDFSEYGAPLSVRAPAGAIALQTLLS
jgi:hypothetical protein